MKDWKALRDLRFDWHYAHMAIWENAKTEKHFSVFLAWYLSQIIRHLLGQILCHFFGHPATAWEQDDWGGPEGGGMAGGCNKCGFSYHHTLY